MPWLIWTLGALFFTYTFFQRTNPSAMVDSLMRVFEVSAAALGNLSAVYFYAYAAMQIPAGILFDRWDPRWILAFAATASAGGAALFAVAPSVDVAVVGRILIGVSGGVSYMGILTLSMLWFPRERYAVLVGLSMPFGIVGGVLGQAPFSALLRVLDWRDAMWGTAGPALLLALLFWLSRTQRPPADVGIPARPAGMDRRPTLLAPVRRAAREPQAWVLSISGAFFVAPMFSFAGVWAVPYMMQVHGLERTVAAGSASLMLIGLGIGAFLSGWLSNRLHRCKAIYLAGMAVALAGWLVVVFVPGLPVAVHCLLFALIGIAKGTSVLTYIAAQDHTGAATSSTGSAIINTFYLGGGALAQYIIGLLLDARWTGQIDAGVRIYSAAAYDAALLAMPASVAIGLIVGLAVRETHPNRDAEGVLP